MRSRPGKIFIAVPLALVAVLGPAAAVAPAKEKVLTLYSPKLVSEPYVHKNHQVTLKPDGREAPKEPGYVLGFKEQVLVDSKDPKAKPLPIAKMMVHHFLYFARGRLDQGPPGCWGGSGFLSGRGEEHPTGKLGYYPKVFRDNYGLHNRKADGTAPEWQLTAMVMNHYQKVKTFYVRTRIWYTTEKRKPQYPITIGDCKQLGNGMSYDVPGGGKKGSNFVTRGEWTAPDGFRGRLFGAHSHHHGGGKYATIGSKTCNRQIFKANVYHGKADHPYNTIRPILHEPGPIANGTFRTNQGVPVVGGDTIVTKAVHDNHNLHVAAMGFWTMVLVDDPNAKRCQGWPKDIEEVQKPKEYDRTPDYELKVPQLVRPPGKPRWFSGGPLEVGDDFFDRGKVLAKPGQKVTWNFSGQEPHSVTVANGPRGFSSVYWGQTRGQYSFTPKVKGTYRLTCLVHPTRMAQTLIVK